MDESREISRYQQYWEEQMGHEIPDNSVPSTSYVYKHCVHDAFDPILIGGHEVYFGACRDIHEDTVERMDLICPLNGDLPNSHFGRLLYIVACELTDRGGVPKQWESFIKGIASAIGKGRRVLGYCMGGHGRTGVFGASLISIMEPDTVDPIAAMRERHCKKAVESKAQAEAVFALRGLPLPEIYLEEFKPIVYAPTQKGSYTYYPKGASGYWKDGKWYETKTSTTGAVGKVIETAQQVLDRLFPTPKPEIVPQSTDDPKTTDGNTGVDKDDVPF